MDLSLNLKQENLDSKEKKNLIVLCDGNLEITGVINNGLELKSKKIAGKNLEDIISAANSERLRLFIDDLKSKKIVLDFEILASTGQRQYNLSFSGIKIDKSYLIIVTNSSFLLENLFDEMSRIANEQTNIIRKIAQEKIQVERIARQRIERDLHDSVSQTIFSTRIIAEIIPDLWKKDRKEANRQLKKIKMLAEDSLTEMRRILLELRPDAFSEENIKDLVKQLVKSAKLRSDIEIKLRISGKSDPGNKIKKVIYRVAQESLNNAIKHSEARLIKIDLKLLKDRVELEVKDDGVGFDDTKVAHDKLGLYIMNERARSVNSDFKILSEKGTGTKVKLTCNY